MNRKVLSVLLVAILASGFTYANATPTNKAKNNNELVKKEKKTKKSSSQKKNKKDGEQPKPTSAYKRLTGRDSLALSGVMNVIQRGDTVYLEIPTSVLGKPFLVSNKLQQVPIELNEASANKGINYANQMVRFEWDKQAKTVKMRQQRVTPEVPANSHIARSVNDNYIDPIIAALKVEQVAPDSTAVIVKVSDLFNGKKNILNDVFNDINLGTSPVSELSRIVSVKAYERSVVALSELTTTVREGLAKVNVTVVVSTAICLLPDEPMMRRREDGV